MVHRHIFSLIYIVIIALLYLVAWLSAQPVLLYITIFLAVVPIAWKGLTTLITERKINNSLFLLFAALVSIVGHEEKAIIFILLIMLIADYIEHAIEERTEESINMLVHYIPKQVHVIQQGAEKNIPLVQLKIGNHIIVKEGERIPVDGVIVKGKAAINEAPLTGESMPREKGVNELVFAGTFLESGYCIIEVQKIGEQTLFGYISQLIEQAQQEKAPISQLADRVANILVPALLLFIFLVWFFTRNISLVVTLLVFGAPVELALVTPLTLLAAMIGAFRHGILVKGGRVIELFSRVTVMSFDKTGTLTLGEPHVVGIACVDRCLPNEVLRIAAIAEKKSSHVVAKAIAQRAAELKITVPDPDSYLSLTGHGVEVIYQKERYLVGNRHFIEAPEHGNIVIPFIPDCAPGDLSHTVLYVAREKNLIGKICIADEIRQDSRALIQALYKLGIQEIFLLSGDRKEVVDSVAAQLKISKAYAQVFPEQKLELIKKVQHQGKNIAMVGDGINDAPALKQANVGIAMGAMGMEPAMQAADIVLMDNNLQKIAFLYELSKNAMRAIYYAIIGGLVITHGLGMIAAFFGYINPLQAALIHGIVDIAMVINAARFITFKGFVRT